MSELQDGDESAGLTAIEAARSQYSAAVSNAGFALSCFREPSCCNGKLLGPSKGRAEYFGLPM